MSIEHITTKITRDAEGRAQSCKDQAKQRQEALEAETKAAKQELQAAAAQALTKKKEQRKAVRLSLAKQNQHIAKQLAKRQALDAVLEEARQKLAAAPAEQYVATLQTQLKQQDIQSEAIRTVVAPQARQSETEQVLTSLTITAPVEYVDDLTGGLVLQADDYTIDLSFDRWFRDATAALEGVAAKVLFSS